MKTAVCAGSFDPVTLGHLDVICRAAELFDQVYVCAVVNSEKSHGLFTPQQRLCLLKKALQHLPNVSAEQYGGLVADYARERQADVLVRGIRGAGDAGDELLMAQVNYDLGGMDTVLFPARKEHVYLSSTVVRELLQHGADLRPYVPETILEDIQIFWDSNKRK